MFGVWAAARGRPVSFLLQCDGKDQGDECWFVTSADKPDKGWSTYRSPGRPVQHFCPEHNKAKQ